MSMNTTNLHLIDLPNEQQKGKYTVPVIPTTPTAKEILSSNLWDELDYFENLPIFADEVTEAADLVVSENQSSKFREQTLLTKAKTLAMQSSDHTPQSKESINDIEKEESKRSEDPVKLKRKAAVAAASRATRAKKKRELEHLRKRNSDLLRQRQQFLQTIADLQLKVQANRESGTIDLCMENTLLRAELTEHKNFIAQFKRVADGMPTSNDAKRALSLQGADAAIAQVLGLLSTSLVDPTWKRGYSRTHPEITIHYQRLPHGSTAKTASRINIRADIPFAPLKRDLVADIQWKCWVDTDLATRLSSSFGAIQNLEIKEIDTGLNEIDIGSDRQLRVMYYREERAERARRENEVMRVLDTIFLMTSKKLDLPFNEIETTKTKENTKKSPPRMLPTTVLATTSTKHSKDIEPEKEGVNRIQSAMLEGIVIRETAKETCALTVVNSYPLNPEGGDARSDFLSASSSNGWIGDDGFFTEPGESALSEFFKIFMENVDPATIQKYFMHLAKVQVESNINTRSS